MQAMEPLSPLVTVNTRFAFEREMRNSEELREVADFQQNLLVNATEESFTVDGYCIPCEHEVSFIVDMKWGGQRHANGWSPNWRERLECPLCHMNNRQRLMATLIK